MRGPSDWSVADRELMAAYISKMNETEFCVAAHTATSVLAYNDGAKVSATVADLETAPLSGPLRATLRMLGKLTRESNLDADDIRRVLAAGASEQQIKDATRGRILIQCDRPIGRRLRFRCGRPRGNQRRRKVPARSRLPVTADQGRRGWRLRLDGGLGPVAADFAE